MIISYESELIRDLCEDEIHAISAFGEEIASIFFSRLSDIEAANNPSELVVGNPHEETIDGLDCYKVNITESISIIFTTVLSAPNKSWKNVHRIKILKVIQL